MPWADPKVESMRLEDLAELAGKGNAGIPMSASEVALLKSRSTAARLKDAYQESTLQDYVRRQREFEKAGVHLKEKEKEESALRFLKDLLDQKTKFNNDTVDTRSIGKLKKILSNSYIFDFTKPSGEQFSRANGYDFLKIPWFDLRGIGAYDLSMAETALEAVEQKLLSLPYEICVFVYNYDSNGGHHGSTAVVLTHIPEEDAKLLTLGSIVFPTSREAVGWYESLSQLNQSEQDNSMAYYSLAVMSSPNATPVRRFNKGGIVEDSARPNVQNSYTQIVINGSQYEDRGASMGERKSPRMHWRRGHVRRYKTGDTLWISPQLIGCAENGLSVSDYKVKG